MSGPSITNSVRAKFTSSGESAFVSGRPSVPGRSFQPRVPSKMRVNGLNCSLSSKRVRFGRLSVITNGIRSVSRPPCSRCPSHTIVSTLRQASRPPRAATLRSMTSAAVLARLPSPAGFLGPAGVATVARTPAHMAPQMTVNTSRRILALLGARRCERGELRLAEQGIVHRLVHGHPRNRHLVRLFHALDGGLLQTRHGEAILGFVVAKINGDVVHSAVELAGLAVHLELEEAAGIDPQIAFVAVLQRELQFVGGVPFDRLRAGERDLRGLSGVGDPTAGRVLLRSGRFHFGGREPLPFLAVEEGTYLPTLRPVVHLQRGLILEDDLEPALLLP